MISFQTISKFIISKWLTMLGKRSLIFAEIIICVVSCIDLSCLWKMKKNEEEYQTAVYKYRAVPLCSVWTLSGELIQRRWYQAGQLYQHHPVKGLRIQKWTQNVKNCKLVVFVPCKSMISGQLYQHHPSKHPNYFGREQKFWYPHIRKPLGHLVRFVFFCLGMEPNIKKIKGHISSTPAGARILLLDPTLKQFRFWGMGHFPWLIPNVGHYP